MSRIDRALRRRLERREKRRSLRQEAVIEKHAITTQSTEITGQGWATHKHGPSMQQQKADGAADTEED